MMRAGANNLQQTLTPEAATILKYAVAEACRRGHAQATPLHVAAALIGAPGSPLRRACLRTHPRSPHSLQCRDLEICFNVALDRLQAAQGPLPGGQPSYSNALVAALKRAQAHQRRGYPEQQQQPLLAVKVELEQLVISILDDPSVSRVMREAGFSSTDAKNHLEEMVSLISAHHSATSTNPEHARLARGAAMDHIDLRLGVVAPMFLANTAIPQRLPPYNALPFERSEPQLQLGPRRAVLYTRQRTHLSSGWESPAIGGDDVKRILEVLMRMNKRNPVLLGEPGFCTEAVIRVLMHRMERCNVPTQLLGVKFLSAELSAYSVVTATKEEIELKFNELNKIVEGLIPGGAIIHVGDLQWLLENSQQKESAYGPFTFCPAKYAMNEVGQILARHGNAGRLWLIGTATCQTYLRCQVQHPTMEGWWDLQPVPITSSGVCLSLQSRYKSQESNSLDASLRLTPCSSRGAPLTSSSPEREGPDKLNCCSECMAKYDRELQLLHEQERHAHSDSQQSCSSSLETSSKEIDNERPSRSMGAAKPGLPSWLQSTVPPRSVLETETSEAKEKVITLDEKLQELKKKWNHTCHSLHVVQHLSCSNISSDQMQQPSPSSSQASGGTSADGKDNAQDIHDSGKGAMQKMQKFGVGFWPLSACLPSRAVKPITSAFTSMNGSSPSVGTDLSLGRPSMGVAKFSSPSRLSEYHQQQANANKERLQDQRGCSPSKFGFTWKNFTAGEPVTPTTDAGGPGCQADHGQPNSEPSGFWKMDPDASQHLCKGLAERVGWQKEAISAIANTVVQCRSGMSKRRRVNLKGDTWLLLLGPDQLGKRKMAQALAEVIFGSEKKLTCIRLGRQNGCSSPSVWNLEFQELDMHVGSFRGRLPLDRLAEAVRLNPFSVILLEDVDQCDSVLKSRLIQAMEKGRLLDSRGKEISFANAIVVMTTSIGVDCYGPCQIEKQMQFTESRLAMVPAVGVRLLVDDVKSERTLCRTASSLAVVEHSLVEEAPGPKQSLSISTSKRKAEWNVEEAIGGGSKKKNTGQAFTLDLNLSAEENAADYNPVGSKNALEVAGLENNSNEGGEEQLLNHAHKYVRDFCELVDAAIIFRPFDFKRLTDSVLDVLNEVFLRRFTPGSTIEIDVKVLEQIIAAVWWASSGKQILEKWAEDVLEKSLSVVLTTCSISPSSVLKLLPEENVYQHHAAVSLPNKISLDFGSTITQEYL